MNDKQVFPIPFQYSSIYSQSLENIESSSFIVCAFLTSDFTSYADRLSKSCSNFKIPYVLYQIPSVHQSISPKGSNNPEFTKANFISFVLEQYDMPVLYMDVDCYIAQYPENIKSIIAGHYDFAIFNWFAEEHTETYAPVEVSLQTNQGMQTFKDRFFRFSHSVDNYATDYLLCSGAVQFYNNNVKAKKLLKKWHDTVLEFDIVADDLCLNYTFNYHYSTDTEIKPYWLEKSYMRIGWWIYEKPVIDHPDFPSSENKFVKRPDKFEKHKWWMDKTELKSIEYIIPRDCLLDTETKFLMKLDDGQMVPYRRIDIELWLQKD